LKVSGTVGKFESLLGVSESLFRENATTVFYAPTSGPWMPGNYAALVDAIQGLDNYTHPVPVESPCSSPYCPQGIRVGYSISSLLGSGQDGSGITVAVVDAPGDSNIQSAINTYDSQYNLASTTLAVLYPDGIPSSYDSGWALETALDVESVHTVAPGAHIAVLYAGPTTTDLVDLVDYVATHHIANVVSDSWVECLCSDTQLSGQYVSSIDLRLAVDSSLGLTILFASGDWGATPDGANLGTMFPASDPNVLAVGATNLALSGCGTTICTGYSSETGAVISGGGYSGYFSEPPWQTSAIGTISGRGVPDVSMFGYQPFYWTYSTNGGGWRQVAGTSLSSPLWAGVLAILDQSKGGVALGNVAPMLWQLASSSSYAADFHDVTSGNNNYYGTGGYPAVLGWDPVTGWGTPIASALSSSFVTTPSGTITLSQSSGVPVFSARYNDFGNRITVTGTGFPPGQNDIQIVLIPSTTSVTAAVASGCSSINICDLGSLASRLDPSLAGSNAGTVMADANGWFKAQIDTPVVQGGSYLIYAIYPASKGDVATATVPFAVTQAIYVVSDFTGGANSGAGDPIQLAGVGFGSGEQIQPIPSGFFTNGAHPAITTSVTPGVNEGTFDSGPETGSTTSCVLAGGSYCVGQLVGGSHTLTILGLSSGISATETYTINPELYFGDPTCTFATYSIDTSAGAKVCVYGTGFAKSATVAAAGSVTIGGVSTIHGEIDSDVNGNFPDTGITLAQATGVGPLNVVLGGTTFSYPNGNIYQPNPALFDFFQGVLVGSHAGQGALMSLPEGSSRRIGQSGALIGFGYAANLAYGGGGGNNLRFVLNPNGIFFQTVGGGDGGDATDSKATDANGAFMAYYLVPTVQHYKYTLHDDTPSNASPDSTFTVNPDVRLCDDSTSAGWTNMCLVSGTYGGLDSQAGLTALGVATPPKGDLTVYINGYLWANCASVANLCDANILADGQLHFNALLPSLGAPGITSTDLPQGSYSVNITGTYGGDWALGRFHVDTATGTVSTLTVDPIALTGSLSTISGPAGTIDALQTGAIGSANPGVHGLAANTQYKIMWDGTTQLGTFTSTSTGGVPVGTQFTVPTGTSGIHIVDIQTTSGASAIWGQVKDYVHSQFGFLNFALTPSVTTTATQTTTLTTTITSPTTTTVATSVTTITSHTTTTVTSSSTATSTAHTTSTTTVTSPTTTTVTSSSTTTVTSSTTTTSTAHTTSTTTVTSPTSTTVTSSSTITFTTYTTTSATRTFTFTTFTTTSLTHTFTFTSYTFTYTTHTTHTFTFITHTIVLTTRTATTASRTTTTMTSTS